MAAAAAGLAQLATAQFGKRKPKLGLQQATRPLKVKRAERK